MKEKYLEARLKQLKFEEFGHIQEIGQLEETLKTKKATLISTRGGILEVSLALKDEEEE